MQAKEKMGKNWTQLESFVLRTYSIRKFSVFWYLNSEQKHKSTTIPRKKIFPLHNLSSFKMAPYRFIDTFTYDFLRAF